MAKNKLLRHQLLVRRLIKTQANATKKYIKQAAELVIKNSKKPIGQIEADVKSVLNKMVSEALKIPHSLGEYESKYIAKVLGAEQFENSRVRDIINTAVLNTSINGVKNTIANAYRRFADNKASQLSQILLDAQFDEEDIEETVNERVRGMFTTQNLALAGLAINTTSEHIKNEYANENNLQVEWVLDLELNNCAYCEDLASNSPYDPEEVEGGIPVHSNCGCTLVPILDE